MTSPPRAQMEEASGTFRRRKQIKDGGEATLTLQASPGVMHQAFLFRTIRRDPETTETTKTGSKAEMYRRVILMNQK